MSTGDPDRSTSTASRVRPEGRLLGRLRTGSRIAVVAGAVGSVGLMLRAGHPPLLLRVIFAVWVLSPFTGLLLADMISNRWTVITRATLHSVMLVLTLSSLAIYGHAVLRPPRSTPAFPFVVVPLGSWLMMIIAAPIAALISGRRSRRGAGA